MRNVAPQGAQLNGCADGLDTRSYLRILKLLLGAAALVDYEICVQAITLSLHALEKTKAQESFVTLPGFCPSV